MKSVCIGQPKLPSTSRLFADYLARFDSVASFYAHPPTLDAVREAACEARLEPSHRAALVAALAHQNTGGGAIEESLDRLAQPNTVAVVSGQQVGLFAGPLFTFYKALTAAKLAARLCDDGVSAVPVFWLATEDHDLAEVDHTWVFDASGEPVRLQTNTNAGESQAVGSVEIEDAPIESLRAALSGFPHGADVAGQVAAAWQTGQTLGGAFARFLGELLAPYGVLLLDPTFPEVRSLAAPFLARAVENMPELASNVVAQGKRLRDAGYHEQVKVADSASCIFLTEDDRRIGLSRKDGRFTAGKRSWSAEELIAENESTPGALSPNALLRPVLQDFLLPTAAFVVGPAELAYLAQSAPLYEGLLGRMPVILPRASFTLLDARGAKLLKRYELTARDCWVPAAELEQRIAQQLVPAELIADVDSARGQVAETLDGLAASLDAFDPSLREAFDRSRRKITYQLDKTRRKTEREAFRRDVRAQAETAELGARLYPHRALQERFYCALPFLAQRGPELLDAIYEAVDPEAFCHQILEI